MFKKIKILVLASIIGLVLIPNLVLAQENFRQGEAVTLNKGEVINKDYFAAGEKVTLSGEVNGDAYLAGGNIVMDGVVNGDLLVAGGNVNILGKVTGDIRAAGGNVNISGETGGNLTTLGGNVDIESNAKTKGSLVSASGNLQLFGPIGKGVTIAGGAATIKNSVNSDVIAAVEELDLSSGANINGNLTYWSNKKAVIASDASVSGKVTQNLPPQADTNREQIASGFKKGFSLYLLLTSLIMGALMLFLAPSYTLKASNLIGEKPWQMLGIGFLILLITPILLIILLVSVIGIPFALIILVYYLFLLLFAHIYTALFVGNWVIKKLNQKDNSFLSLISGLLILAVLGLIPVLGGLIGFVSLLLGIGVALTSKSLLVKELKAKATL